MKKIVWFILLLVFTIQAQAQQRNYSYKVHTPTTKYTATTVNPSTITVDYKPTIQNIEAPKPGTQTGRAELQFLKETMPEFKTTGAEVSTFNAATPTIARSISANSFNNRVPNDNDMAISNDGKIISVINSTIFVYDLNTDTTTLSISLEAFTDTLGPTGDSLSIVGSKFDPKVLYDPDEDRFIILYLNGSTFATSKIIVGFSKTNDPAAEWNLYALEGNPLNDSTWSDYPFIAINNHDLFISINTFYNGSQNNSGFAQSTFWQIDKEDGYNGNTLTTAYYHDIEFNGANLFNTTPVRGGSGNYGPQMYLLSNFAQAQTSSSFFLLTVTDRVKGGTPELVIDHRLTNIRYGLPPNARQIPRNGSQLSLFDTNDNRILGAFFENNSIQFVMNTRVPSSDLCGIYHGFINYIATTKEVTGNILSDTLDIGFPNIAYTGKSALENEAIINFNHSGPFTGAGNGVFFYDNNGNYSPLTFVKQSNFYVDVLGGAVERWGDYTGSQRKYNEPGVIWYCGYDALEISTLTQRGTPNTWISEIMSPTATSTPQSTNGSQIAEVKTFPNPSLNEEFKLEFTVETEMNLDFYLVDNKGSIITLLISERVKAGKNLFTFSTADLAKGNYHLLINNGKTTLKNEKVIKL